MYRQRVRVTLKTIDAWNECIHLIDEYNKLAAGRGWVQGTTWMHTVGNTSEIVAEFDYADLASFQRENDEIIRDKEAVEIFRKFDSLDTEGTGYTELLENAQTVG